MEKNDIEKSAVVQHSFYIYNETTSWFGFSKITDGRTKRFSFFFYYLMQFRTCYNSRREKFNKTTRTI